MIILLNLIRNTLCNSDFGFGHIQPDPAHLYALVTDVKVEGEIRNIGGEVSNKIKVPSTVI
jgi:hypothetical protein